MTDATLYEHALGLSWVTDESFPRTSHALADEGRVWLIDPVDDPVAIERTQRLGEVAGVIQLLDRHNRDCAALAARMQVAHLVNPDSVAGAPFEVVAVVDLPKWRERAIWWPDRRALVVSEAIVTPGVGAAACAVHPMLALLPPKRRLRRFEPEHLLVGHGPPVHGSAANDGLQRALRRSRRDLPRTLIAAFRSG